MKNHKAETIYEKVRTAMEQVAPFDEIYPLIKSLAELGHIDLTDSFGLTISMRAAALGNLDVVKAAHGLGSPVEVSNVLTKANILHYAAQQPNGGADIVSWVILGEKASDDLLNQQIFVPGEERDTDKNWDRGNGHTVAFEAVFNNNDKVLEALIEIENQGHKVDFKRPAVHGQSPLSWALNLDLKEIVSLLKPKFGSGSMNDDELKKQEERLAIQYFEREDDKWFDDHHQDLPARDLAVKLRQHIKTGDAQSQSVELLIDQAIKENGVDPNRPYGRFGQPLLILVPTHPDIMNLKPNDDQKLRYAEVVRTLIDRGADPRTKEKGLMEVSAGFREVFFGFMEALETMIQSVNSSEREDFVNEVGLFNGYTRLIDAALIGNKAAIELLLKHHPDRDIRGFNGWTAYKAAEIHNDKASENDKIPQRILDMLK